MRGRFKAFCAMKVETWVIYWNQKQGHFHIEPDDRDPGGNPNYQEVGMVSGPFKEASDYATKWLEANPKAMAAYRSPFRSY